MLDDPSDEFYNDSIDVSSDFTKQKSHSKRQNNTISSYSSSQVSNRNLDNNNIESNIISSAEKYLIWIISKGKD